MNTRAWQLKDRINYYSIPVTESGCWIWNSVLNKQGYGVLRYRGRFVLAHRLSYQEFVNQIPDGLLICHHCDTPACVNPHHLFVGTSKDNQQDSIKKKRHRNNKKKYCKNGHEFNLENTYIQPKLSGSRYCRKCHTERERKRRNENR